jgi:hypothetical protein
MGFLFLLNVLKALFIIAGMGFVLSLACLIIVYIIEVKEFREEFNSGNSTVIGNALFIIHSFLEPGRKPQTEQVIWIKRRRTPLEKGVRGISELMYDKISIKGYKKIKNLRYRKKL